MLLETTIDLNRDNARKLLQGKGVVIKPIQLRDPGMGLPIKLDKVKLKRMMRNASKHKGTKLKFSQSEMDANKETIGGKFSFKSLGRAIKQGFEKAVEEVKDIGKAKVEEFKEPVRTAKKVVKRVVKKVQPTIQTAEKLTMKGIEEAKKAPRFYKERVKNTVAGEVIRRGAKKAISEGLKKAVPLALATGLTALGTVTAQPEIVASAPVVSGVAKKFGDKFGDDLANMAVKKLGLGMMYNENSNFIHPANPNFHPIQDTFDHSVSQVYKRRGGSFRALGGKSYMAM